MKTVLVTGGTSGIGLATAKAFVRDGYRVMVVSRSQERVDDAVTEIGNSLTPYASGTVLGHSADIGVAEEMDGLADRVRAEVGELDTVFANAGIARFATIADTSPDMLDAVLSTNVVGTFNTMRALSPLVKSGGSIVVTTSINKDVGMPMSGAYAASKAAAAALVRVLAAELIGRKIRVNAVSPGPVDTPIYTKLGLPKEQVKAFAADMRDRIPVGRFAKPEDIAQAVLFLASDRAAFMTGEEITVDGGWTSIGPVSFDAA